MHHPSKTLATWLAVIAGPVGAHRFYLRGARDAWAWMYLPPTLAGLAGVQRMRAFGQDDFAATWLVPLLGLSISAAMFSAIIIGLTPDERWDQQRHNSQPVTRSGWPAVLGVIAALLLGGAVLMGTVAYTVQKIFEQQAQAVQNSERPMK